MGGYHGTLIPSIVAVLVAIAVLFAFGGIAIQQHKHKKDSHLYKRSAWPMQLLLAILPLIAFIFIANFFSSKYLEIDLLDLDIIALGVITIVLYAISLFIVHNLCGLLGKSRCKLKDK
jgi:ABC-type xylose transport system permease subunit